MKARLQSEHSSFSLLLPLLWHGPSTDCSPAANLLQRRFLHGLQGMSAVEPAVLSHPPSLVSVLPLLFLILFSSPSSSVHCFSLFLKHVFTKAEQKSLMGSALTCSRSLTSWLIGQLTSSGCWAPPKGHPRSSPSYTTKTLPCTAISVIMYFAVDWWLWTADFECKSSGILLPFSSAI